MKYPLVRPELPDVKAWLPYVEEAYAANWFTNFGRISRRFEALAAARWGFDASVCVAASSATAALAAPLIAKRVEGVVLLPAFTFPATYSAIRMSGLTPAFCDVDETSWVVTPQMLDKRLSETAAAAAVLVCPFGHQTDFSEHVEVARRHRALLVLDNAAGLGVSRRNWENAGVFEIYSLHATKPFGIGEGGLIFADKDEERHLRSAINFGLPALGADGGPAWGINGKMAEVQAAVAVAGMDGFDERLARRRVLAQSYIDALIPHSHVSFLTNVVASCWQLFPVLMSSESAVLAAQAHASNRGMEVRRYYRPALSSMPAPEQAQCPISEDLARRMVCFPIYSRVEVGEAEEMVAIVSDAVASAMGL